jgi:endonuclease III
MGDLQITPVTTEVLQKLVPVLEKLSANMDLIAAFRNENSEVKRESLSFQCVLGLENRGWLTVGEMGEYIDKKRAKGMILLVLRAITNDSNKESNKGNNLENKQDRKRKRKTGLQIKVVMQQNDLARERNSIGKRKVAPRLVDGGGNNAYMMAKSSLTREGMVYSKREFVFAIQDRTRVYKHESEPKVIKAIKTNCDVKQGIKKDREKKQGNHWTPFYRKERREKNGHETYYMTELKAAKVLDHTTFPEAAMKDYLEEKERGVKNKTSNMAMFLVLQELEGRCKTRRGIVSIRSNWLEAFTARCKMVQLGQYSGCGRCGGCFNRFCQATMLVKSASGVSDLLVVMHWGAIFRSRRFKEWTIKEWAALEPWEYAIVANACSCSTMNALYVLPMLKLIASKSTLPKSVEEIVIFYGFGVKSAALILNAVYGKNFAVAVDRHLSRIFQGLGWCNEYTKDETRIAAKIMSWLDRRYWGRVNDLFAGLSQLLADVVPDEKRREGESKYLYRDVILEEARQMDRLGKKKKMVSAEDLVMKLISILPKKHRVE